MWPMEINVREYVRFCVRVAVVAIFRRRSRKFAGPLVRDVALSGLSTKTKDQRKARVFARRSFVSGYALLK